MAINVRVKAKFRAFGHDWGKFEETKDVTAVITTLAVWIFDILKIHPPTNISVLLQTQKLPGAYTLYDNRGVFVELR